MAGGPGPGLPLAPSLGWLPWPSAGHSWGCARSVDWEGDTLGGVGDGRVQQGQSSKKWHWKNSGSSVLETEIIVFLLDFCILLAVLLE